MLLESDPQEIHLTVSQSPHTPSPCVMVAPSCSALRAAKLCFSECDSTGDTLSFFDARVSVSYAPCSSEQSAKAKTQKELFKTLKELKMHLPSEKRSKGKSSTVNTLKYALRCVKQVKGKTRFCCFHAHAFIHIVVNKCISFCMIIKNLVEIALV